MKEQITRGTVNMNSLVKFKLTEYGENINKIFEFPLETKVNKYYECRMWQVMKAFGSYLDLGGKALFIDNNIIIIDENGEC